MFKKISLLVLTSTLFVGCASVPMESADRMNEVKAFPAPAAGKAGLYVYRTGVLGAALKKDVWVDGDCIGQTAPDVFFYEQVKGGAKHTVSTESEFSPNDLSLTTEAGKNYFVHQYIKMGLMSGGAGLELIDADKGMEVVSKLDMAKKGPCSK